MLYVTTDSKEDRNFSELARSFAKIHVNTEPYPLSFPDDNEILVESYSMNYRQENRFFVMKKRQAHDLSPFIIESMSLFPEWYYYFKQNFLKISDASKLFCSLSKKDFDELFEIPGDLNAYYKINRDVFSGVVHFHIDKYLNKEDKKKVLTPEVIEGEMWDKLQNLSQDDAVETRRNYLTLDLRYGDCIPLCHHLLAFGYSRWDIWKHAIHALREFFRTRETTDAVKLLNEILPSFMATNPLVKMPEFLVRFAEEGYMHMDIPKKVFVRKQHQSRGTFVLTTRPYGIEAVKSEFVILKGRRAIVGPPDHHVDTIPTPILGMNSLRFMLAYAARNKMIVRQLQIDAAYMDGDRNNKWKDALDRRMFRLDKTIHGRKMSLYIWYDTISSGLKLHGLEQGLRDQCLFTKGEGSDMILVGLYSHELIVVAKSVEDIEQLSQSLRKTFQFKNLGKPSLFIGMNLKFKYGQVRITVKDRIHELVRQFIRSDEETDKTPLDLEKWEGEERKCGKKPYASLVGKLRHLAETVRFDISFVTSALWRHISAPKVKHLDAAKQVLRYLELTADFGLVYDADSPADFYAYSSAHPARGDPHKRYLTAFMLNYSGSPISWKTSLPTLRTFTDDEAAILAMSLSCGEVEWMAEINEECQLEATYHICTSNREAYNQAGSKEPYKGRKRFARNVDYIRELVNLPNYVHELVDEKENISELITNAHEEKNFILLCEKATNMLSKAWCDGDTRDSELDSDLDSEPEPEEPETRHVFIPVGELEEEEEDDEDDEEEDDEEEEEDSIDESDLDSDYPDIYLDSDECDDESDF